MKTRLNLKATIPKRTRIQLKKANRPIYNYLHQNNKEALDALYPMSLTIWTEEKIREVAKGFKRRIDFSKTFHAATQTAKRLGIWEDVCSHMPLLYKKWTEEEIFQEAAKFASLKDFRRESNKAYEFARNHNLIAKTCAHMQLKIRLTDAQLIEIASTYGMKKDLIRANPKVFRALSLRGLFKQACSHMVSGHNKRQLKK